MALPFKRTLGDIRSDIQIRLGFGLAGQAGIVNSPLIDSMILSAQNQLYEQFDFLELKRIYESSTGSNQSLYDYPVDCNVERIQGIWTKWNGIYYPLTEHIDASDRGWNPGGPPQKYERRDQIEIWPVPADNSYSLRIEYIKTLDSLVASSDRVSIRDELVFLHALSNAKAHYRQTDAATYSSQLDALLLKMRAQHRSQTVWGKQKQTRGMYDYADSSQDV